MFTQARRRRKQTGENGILDGISPGPTCSWRRVTLRPRSIVVVIAMAGAATAAWPALRRANERTRQERARYDAGTITGALFRFYTDNAFFPLWARIREGGPKLRRVDLLLLVGSGSAPAGSLWVTGTAGMLAEELISNASSYVERGGPGETGGGGPYLPEPPGPDPWNHRYIVNIGLLSAGTPEEADVPKYAV